MIEKKGFSIQKETPLKWKSLFMSGADGLTPFPIIIGTMISGKTVTIIINS